MTSDMINSTIDEYRVRETTKRDLETTAQISDHHVDVFNDKVACTSCGSRVVQSGLLARADIGMNLKLYAYGMFHETPCPSIPNSVISAAMDDVDDTMSVYWESYETNHAIRSLSGERIVKVEETGDTLADGFSSLSDVVSNSTKDKLNKLDKQLKNDYRFQKDDYCVQRRQG